MGIEGKCLNIMKATYDKPSTNILLNSEKQDKNVTSHYFC